MVGEQARGRRRGDAEEHGVGLDDLGGRGRPDDEPPAGCRALQAAHDGAGAQRRTARAQLGGEQAGQPADPSAQAGERRRGVAARSDAGIAVGRRDRGCRAPTWGRQQALAAGRPLPQHGHRGPQRQPGRVAGVDPAEQGLDEPVDDRPAEPGADVVADRDVGRDDTARPGLLGAQPNDLVVGEQAARGVGVGGHAHQGGAGHRGQATARPDRGRGGGGGDEVAAGTEAADEVGGLRTHGEHRLGTDVDEVAGDGLEAELPAEPVAPLEDADPRRGQGVEHLERRAQTRDATPHDDDVGPGGDGLRGHVASLSRAPDAADATLDHGIRRPSPHPAGAHPGIRRPGACPTTGDLRVTGPRRSRDRRVRPVTVESDLPRSRDRIETRHGELRRHAGRPSASSTPTTGPTKESPCVHRSAPPADSALPQRRSPSPPWPSPGAAVGRGDSGAAGGGSTQSEEMAVGGDKSAAVAEDSAAGPAAQPPQDRAAVAPAVLDRKLSRRADISLTVKDVDVAAEPRPVDRGLRQGHGARRGDLERARPSRDRRLQHHHDLRPDRLPRRHARRAGQARGPSTPATPPPTT